jgi:protein gp37
MAENTKIEWATHTWNPVVGCQKVSPGCDHCYAEAWAKRSGIVQWGPHAGRRRTAPASWRLPHKWNANHAAFFREHGHRQRVFCASLADVFDNRWERQWRSDMWSVIRATPNLDYLLLTKRPQNIARMLPRDWGDGYPNVWLGITTEDADRFKLRWPILARIPGIIRFISYEPAIGPLGRVDIGERLPDWVICGGESGGHARVMQPAWARHVRDQCVAFGIAYLPKQWGTYRSNPFVQEHGLAPAEAAQRDPPINGKGGALLDGRLHRDFPATEGRLTKCREIQSDISRAMTA